jgi:hypothetical protein
MKWTVYALLDPRDETVFYVGISIYQAAYRLTQHQTDSKSAAFPRLRSLADLGLKGVVKEIAHFDAERDARDYESYLISRTPGLLNKSAPYGKHPDTTPTSRPNWPLVGGSELTYEPDGPQSEEEEMRLRSRRVCAALGGTIDEEAVLSVLRVIATLADEDAEFVYPSDE